MLRREFVYLTVGSLLSACAVGPRKSSLGPPFWSMRRGEGRVFLFGFADAKDEAWFTPRIQQAFEQSSELWLEIAPPPSGPPDPATIERIDSLRREPGRTFFDALEPSVRTRVSAYISELGIDRSSIEPLRPWSAYYVINSAYMARTKPPFETVSVENVLTERATRAGKSIDYEMPGYEVVARLLAGMSDAAQSQYIEFLLDYIDEHKTGLNEESFSWSSGQRDTRQVDRMRTRTPDLYQVMQVQRNGWWAHKIDELLAVPKTSFVGVGKLHVLGPHGIPSQLKQLGIAPESFET